MSTRRRLLALVAALLIVATAVVWRLSHQNQTAADPSVASSSSGAPILSQSAGPELPASSARPAKAKTAPSSGKSTGTSAQCSTSVSFVPTKFTIMRLNISVNVVPVNEQSSAGTMAPPVDQPWEVAWIDTTNKPGSTSPGVIDLTAHTYHAGGAIGNSLYQTNPLKTGDLIVLSDGSGHSACYRYTHLVKFAAASYDPNSNVFYDPQGKPEVRLMICWDYNWSTTVWQSRVVFYASPVTS